MARDTWLLLGLWLTAYCALLFLNPARTSLRDGWRCVARYPELWQILAFFGCAYAVFQVALRGFYFLLLPEGQHPIFQWQRAWFLPRDTLNDLAFKALLTAAENLAGLFHNLVGTYPVSAVIAFLVLLNYRGHTRVLREALLRRLGWTGYLMHAFTMLCAVAACLKPLLYAGLPKLAEHLPHLLLLQLGSVIDWLSFLFEYLLGFCVQIYLILLAFIWVRGLSFTRDHLIDFAIRRLGVLMRWAALAMGISTLFIHIPLIIGNFLPFPDWLPRILSFVDTVSRPVLAGFFILFASVQITLVFHSESLRSAIRDHFRFVCHNPLQLLGFLVFALFTFYSLALLNALFPAGLGEGTAAVLIWQITHPLFWALVAAWLLASWVCFYRRYSTGRVPQF